MAGRSLTILTFVDPNNVMTTVRLILDDFRFSFQTDGENEKRAVISVPMGEYEFRIIGYYGELMADQNIHIIADGDKETTVNLEKPEIPNKGTVSLGTLPLTGNVSATVAFEDESDVNRFLAYRYDGNPLEVSAGTYTVSIELYTDDQEISYTVSGLKVNEGSDTMIQLGLDITGKLRAFDDTFVAGDGISFEIIDAADQYGNRVSYFYSYDALTGTLTFVDTADSSKKFTSSVDMYDLSYASAELDEKMDGTYDVYLTINSNANIPTTPTKPSNPGSNGGSTGGSSYRPSTREDEPKIGADIEYRNIGQKKTTNLDTTINNDKMVFKAYFESHAIGLFANLAKKNGTALEYIGSAKIGKDGVALLPYSASADLVIVVCGDDLTAPAAPAPALTALDAADILKYCVGMTTLDAAKISAYDADGVVNSLDASRILKTIVGIV